MLSVEETAIDLSETRDVYPFALSRSKNSDRIYSYVYIIPKDRKRKTIPLTWEADRDSYVSPFPGIREAGLVVGPSGVGKSTWMAKYADTWIRVNREGNKVIVFTPKPDDPAYSEIKELVVFADVNMFGEPKEKFPSRPIDAEFGTVVEDFQLHNLRDSLLIFDDIELIPNKRAATAIKELRAHAMFGGRHDNISVLSSNHQFRDFNGRLNAAPLTESNFVVLFPGNGNEQQQLNLLTEHFQVSNSFARNIVTSKNKWISVRRTQQSSVPYRYVMTEDYAQLCV